jgi:hypothetical protein
MDQEPSFLTVQIDRASKPTIHANPVPRSRPSQIETVLALKATK